MGFDPKYNHPRQLILAARLGHDDSLLQRTKVVSMAMLDIGNGLTTINVFSILENQLVSQWFHLPPGDDPLHCDGPYLNILNQTVRGTNFGP